MTRGTLVSPELRTRIRALGTPIALAFGRLGLTPNALTLIGFAIGCVAGAILATGAWIPGALVLIFGAVFDLFDGTLARATGKASPQGAFLDSVADRASEGVVYIGIAWAALGLDLDRTVILSTAAMTASFMVSYTRAKAESLGFTTGTGMANIGFAPREVRIVILTLGLLAAGLVPDPAAALDASLGLIAVLAAVTSVQRTRHSMRQAAAGEGRR